MEALILAGGKGTRIRSVNDGVPKPMLPVDGRPFVSWVVAYVAAQGVSSITLLTGYKGGVIQAYFEEDPAVSVLQEARPLGTGGAVKNAVSAIGGGLFLVLNGDSFCPFDLVDLVSAHRAAPGYKTATMVVVEVERGGESGAVSIDSQGHITSYQEKAVTGRCLANGGVYLVERSFVEMIPKTAPLSLERDVFPVTYPVMSGFVSPGPLIDIGTPPGYEEACATGMQALIGDRG